MTCFLRTLGYEKKECATDEEARRYAAEMADDSKIYPVVYFESDDEKGYEEFYVPGAAVEPGTFFFFGVIEQVSKRPLSELDSFFD
ncbi:hypothetical protein [Bacteroides hominis]|uniref:hypothetical protein n=1 Tax=Bacteroides hominis TaxID=2763023 RepID=UPI003D6D5E35